MATAKQIVITETKPVDVPAIQLTLTPAEASALHKVLINTGGNGKGRNDVDRVLVALDKVTNSYGLKTEGAVYFRDKDYASNPNVIKAAFTASWPIA